MGKIIRNPLRKRQNEKGSYLPEWARLGVSPTEVFETSKEFQMMPKHKKKKKFAQQQQQQVQQPAPKQSVVPVQQVQANVQVPQPKARGKYDPNWFIKDGDPKLTKVFTEEEVSDPVVPDNILRSKLRANEQESFIVEVEEDDEEEYDESEEEPEDDSAEEEDDYTAEALSELKPKEYALLIRGQVVFSTFDLIEMESTIEDISYNGLDGEQIKFEDISLIRRIPLKIGILAVSRND